TLLLVTIRIGRLRKLRSRRLLSQGARLPSRWLALRTRLARRRVSWNAQSLRIWSRLRRPIRRKTRNQRLARKL
ncbi:hypothetical protein GGI19_006711, partial [Coemansia pectinata]